MFPYKRTIASLLLFMCVTNFVLFLNLINNSKKDQHIQGWTHYDSVIKNNRRDDDTAFKDPPANEWMYNITGSGHTPKQFMVINPDTIPYKHRSYSELDGRVIPNNVFFVWCGNRTFDYRHYVAVMAAWYMLEPDVMELWYEFEPKVDLYNTWLGVLTSSIPGFSTRRLSDNGRGQNCGLSHGLAILGDRGGLYLSVHVLLWRRDLDLMRSRTLTVGIFQNSSEVAFVAGFPSLELQKLVHILNPESAPPYVKVNLPKRNPLRILEFSDDILDLQMCPPYDIGRQIGVENNMCYELPEKLSFRDILNDNTSVLSIQISDELFLHRHKTAATVSRFSPFLPTITSKSQSISQSPSNSSSKKTRIPNIIHYVWFGNKVFTFGMYLSFLSSAHVARPSAIFIHTDGWLTGSYWDKVKGHPLTHVVMREMPRYIFHHMIRYRQHTSDIVRADLLDKYGGIYLDWDAYWLKSPRDLLDSAHDVILTRDHIPRRPYPDTFNMGVVMAVPRSKFIRRWRAEFVNYIPTKFFYNAIELPYKIWEMWPEGVHVEDHLQVMCYYLKCHPTWHRDFMDWNHAQPFDWTTDAYAIHFTHPDPPAFNNETALMASQGMFAEIGRYILEKSKN